MDYPISVPSIGLVNGKFADEDPLAGTPGSLIPSAWGNAVTEEILNVIMGGGLAPSEVNNAQLVLAIKNLIQGAQHQILNDTGVAGAYAAANPTPLTALPATGFIQRVKIATANPGASTYSPDGLAPKPVYGLGLQPLQGGELPVGVAVLMYLVQAGVNGGNGAWVIIESLGGPAQVAAATKSQHAAQLGQVQSLITNMQVFTSSGSFPIPANVTKVKYRAIGPGGGGGSSSIAKSSAGGAGCGGYSEGVINVAASGTLTITIGAGGGQGTGGGAGSLGGTTTITGTGVSVSCPSGGVSGGVTTANTVGAPGVGGSNPVVSGANVVVSVSFTGAPGQIGTCDGTGGNYFGGNGAPSPFGGPLGGNGGYPGAAYGANGSGGSGGANGNFGGNGSPAMVIIEW